jgi:EVE domain
MTSSAARQWVIVASRDHARRGADGGFIMANHGRKAPLARMSRCDGILVYSPTTTFPKGEPLRAVTFVGEVTGDAPEPSDVIPGGFRRAAALREVEPVPLADIREHLPASRIRFGCFEIDAADAETIRSRVVPLEV